MERTNTISRARTSSTGKYTSSQLWFQACLQDTSEIFALRSTVCQATLTYKPLLVQNHILQV
jgi:hypothetical protein